MNFDSIHYLFPHNKIVSKCKSDFLVKEPYMAILFEKKLDIYVKIQMSL